MPNKNQGVSSKCQVALDKKDISPMLEERRLASKPEAQDRRKEEGNISHCITNFL